MSTKRTFLIAIHYLYIEIGRKDLWKMFVAVVAMLFVGWLMNYPSIMLGDLVDSVVIDKEKGIEEAVFYIFIIGALFLLAEMLTLLRKYLVERVGTSLEREQYVKIVMKLMGADTRVLQQYRSGGLNVKIHRNIEGVVRLLKISFMDFFPVVATSAVAFIMASKNVYIPVIMLVVLMLSIYITRLQIESQDGIRRSLFRKKEDIGSEISEKISNIEYVKSSGNVQYEERLMNDFATSFSETEFTHHKYMMSFDLLKNLIEIAGYISVVVVSIWMAMAGEILPGSVLTFALLYKAFSLPLKELHRILDEGYEACMTVEDLVALHDIEQSANACGKVNIDQMKTANGKELIRVQGLSLSYPEKSGSETGILDGISLSIGKGEVIGFAGESGSGKSTFVKTLIGLVDGFSGDVEIFGLPIRDVDKSSLSNEIAYIPQVSPVFSGSVRDNVLYGVSEISDDEMLKAMEKSKFDVVLEGMEGRLDAKLIEGGKNLSGGEKQRLLLTSIFAKQPNLIILDEATSALDPIMQDAVHSSLLDMQRERNATLLIVAHRLRMLQDVDRIYVFKSGRVVEIGSYDKLNNESDSYFSELVRKEELRQASTHETK